jgi:hypothetical protein
MAKTTRGKGGSDKPLRDARGRWIEGQSGNLKGRTPKKPPEPRSLQQSLAKALAEEVEFTAPDGSIQKGMIADIIARNLVRGMTKATPKVAMAVLRDLHKLSVFELLLGQEVEEEKKEVFTEENRRLLAMVQREMGLDLHDPEKPGWYEGFGLK